MERGTALKLEGIVRRIILKNNPGLREDNGSDYITEDLPMGVVWAVMKSFMIIL